MVSPNPHGVFGANYCQGDTSITEVEVQVRNGLTYVADTVTDDLNNAQSNLRVVAGSPQILPFLTSRADGESTTIVTVFPTFLSEKEKYEQMRLRGSDGKELIRLGYKDGPAGAVPDKPTIRLEMGVCDNVSHLRGMVTLNHLACEVLDATHANGKEICAAEYMLLNNDGYWLKYTNHPDAERDYSSLRRVARSLPTRRRRVPLPEHPPLEDPIRDRLASG